MQKPTDRDLKLVYSVFGHEQGDMHDKVARVLKTMGFSRNDTGFSKIPDGIDMTVSRLMGSFAVRERLEAADLSLKDVMHEKALSGSLTGVLISGMQTLSKVIEKNLTEITPDDIAALRKIPRFGLACIAEVATLVVAVRLDLGAPDFDLDFPQVKRQPETGRLIRRSVQLQFGSRASRPA